MNESGNSLTFEQLIQDVLEKQSRRPNSLSPGERKMIGPALIACFTEWLKTAQWDQALEAARMTGNETLPPIPPTRGLADLPGAMESYEAPEALSAIAEILADLVVVDNDERYRPYLVEIFKCGSYYHRELMLLQLRRLSWKREQIEAAARELFDFLNAYRRERFSGECFDLLMFGATTWNHVPRNPLWVHWILPLLAQDPELLKHIKSSHISVHPVYSQRRATWAQAAEYLQHGDRNVRALTIALLAYWGYPVQDHRAVLVQLTRPEPDYERWPGLALRLLKAANLRPTEEEVQELESREPPEDEWDADERKDGVRRYLKQLRALKHSPPRYPSLRISRQGGEIRLRLDAQEGEWTAFDESRVAVAYQMILKEAPDRHKYTDEDQFGLFILDIEKRTADHLRLPVSFPIQPTYESFQKRSLGLSLTVTRDKTVLISVDERGPRGPFDYKNFLFDCNPETRTWCVCNPGGKELGRREITPGTKPELINIRTFERDPNPERDFPIITTFNTDVFAAPGSPIDLKIHLELEGSK